MKGVIHDLVLPPDKPTFRHTGLYTRLDTLDSQIVVNLRPAGHLMGGKTQGVILGVGLLLAP